jgi:hypothetical protein
MGGVGGKWYFNTKVRDFGCPSVNLATISLYLMYTEVRLWTPFIFTWILTFLALTSYHSWLSKLLGYIDGEERWFNYAMHGGCIGLGAFPLYWLGIGWELIAIRVAVLALVIAMWSHYLHEVNLEEGGRGFFINISLLILLLTNGA